ncbi:transcription initiation factor IIB [Haloarcula salinisoli]
MTDARHDRGLSTKIGYGTGIEVSGSKQRQFARLRRQHNRARFPSKRERNKVYAYTDIRQSTSALELPDSVRDQACALFDSAQSADLLYGRSIEGFAAAVVYAVCRMQSLARTRSEVVSASSATIDELNAAYDAMNRELGLPVGPIDPREYLARYASSLDLGIAVENSAQEKVGALRDAHLIGGKNPRGVAAACLYQAAQDVSVGVTQEALTEVADISRLTIRSTLSDLESLGADD